MRKFYYDIKDKLLHHAVLIFPLKPFFFNYKLFFYLSIFFQNFSRSRNRFKKLTLRKSSTKYNSINHSATFWNKLIFSSSVMKLIKNDFLILIYLNPIKNSIGSALFNYTSFLMFFKTASRPFWIVLKKTFGEGFIYIRGLLIIFFIDACLTDDEPLWEPVEWSLFQTWLFFIFMFAWIAENLITSRYGSFTGRDKRVWLAWYKSFWLIELMYILSYGAASMFVIVPFYYELTYTLPFIYSWWNWYTKVFFF